MTLWNWIALACAMAYATKLIGYSLPERWLTSPYMDSIAGSLTVALLTALTVMNTVAAGPHLAIDARLGALVAAAFALWMRLPFLVVVFIGALACAALRLWF
ncbi:MAG: AzlD domain-containing protein [Mesorhizobium sp.]|nr:AzlD domain-containing protein [Mesorhizobium sp.]MBN9244690.1 AzlD domain-containing protein [Mesorhizobium sp.]